MSAHLAECGDGTKAQPVLSCGTCGKVYKRHDLLVKHERTAHLPEDDKNVVVPKKRGRPKKVWPVVEQEEEKEDEANTVEILKPRLRKKPNEEIFDQLKQNLVSKFPENGSLKLPVEGEKMYQSESALQKGLEGILVGFLDDSVLRKVGWPKKGIMGTLEQLLKVIGVKIGGDGESDEEEEDDEVDTMTRLRRMMMALLGRFIGNEYLESMTNNYSVDQILHYMAQDTVGQRS